MRKTHIFNTRRPRLLRTYVSRSENVSVIVILFAMLGLVAWIVTKQNDFDPAERDLPIELLYNNTAPEIEIYTRPLALWVEPGQAVTTAAFDLGPFPSATLDEDWQPVGRVKHFQADNLYQKINGEAEKFIKQGFVQLSYLVLRSADDGSEIAIELFDQGDLGGSLGIFAEHAAGRPVTERQSVSFFTTSAGVIGRKHRFFFRVAGDRQSRAITDKAARLVEAFATLGGPPAAAPEMAQVPPGFALLHDRLGIAEADIQFQENNVFQYDFASRFWFGNAGFDDAARVFIHIADDSAAAADLFAALIDEQASEYDQVESEGPYTLFRHRFLNTYFAVARDGRYVYGAEQLADKDSVDTLIGQLSENIGDDET